MQERTARCPECGAGSPESLEAYLSRPVEWLSTVGDAASTLGTTWFVLVSAIAALLPIGAAAGLVLLLTLLMLLVATPALVLPLTGPEPGHASSSFSARRLARYCLIATPVCCLAGAAAAFRLVVGTSTLTVSSVTVLETLLASMSVAILPLAVLRHVLDLLRQKAESNAPHRSLLVFGSVLFWIGLSYEVPAACWLAFAQSGLAAVIWIGGTICVLLGTAAFLIRAGYALKIAADQRRRWAAQLRAEYRPATGGAQEQGIEPP
jgi:hypothetical protein